MDESGAVADILDLLLDDLPEILQTVVNINSVHARIIEIIADIIPDVTLNIPLIREKRLIRHALTANNQGITHDPAKLPIPYF